MKILSILALSCALVACGGGGGSTSSSAVGANPGFAGFQPGDSLTYTFSGTPTGSTTGGNLAYIQTRTVQQINADASYVRFSTRSDGVAFTKQTFSASNQETSYLNAGTSCTNSPTTQSPSAPYSVGQTWNYAATRTCITSNSSTSTAITSQGSVTGQETITTPAGSFATNKLVYTDQNTNANGKTTYVYSCWRDITLDRTVLCNYTYSFVPVGQSTATVTYNFVQTLIGLNVNAYARSLPVVQRFAGNWTLNWVGTAPGHCTNIAINATGQISGRCEPATAPFYTWTLSGTVDVHGNINANITSGAALAGRFNSPLDASGTWTNSGGASGTWSAGHL
jgi:hypothetical protein